MDYGEHCGNVADPSRPRRFRRRRIHSPHSSSAPQMRPRSRATVTPQLLRLIQIVSSRRGLTSSVSATNTFQLAEIEDMYVEYARSVVGTDQEKQFVRCDEVLAALFDTDQFDHRNAFVKWAMLSRHFTTVDGQPHRPISAQELELREIDDENGVRREDSARRELYERWKRFEDQKKPTSSPWSYQTELPSEERSKRQRTSDSTDPSNRCVICLDAQRTHAFLHANMIGDTGAHYCACHSCAAKWTWASTGCPVCRAKVIGVIRIHQE